MFPLVVSQDLIQPFKFWHGDVRLGMRYADELYTHVRSYAVSARLDAYELACSLAQNGSRVCVACSPWRYTIWISLRSPLVDSHVDSHVEQTLAVDTVVDDSVIYPVAV
ncbi:MAG TPA: hypothetical protein V6C88_04325 [Chroococcidiopsis sp.]